MHYVFTYFQNVLEWMEMVISKEFTLINWAMCITWLAQHQVCWHMKCHRERYFLSHFHRFWFEGLGGPLTPYFFGKFIQFESSLGPGLSNFRPWHPCSELYKLLLWHNHSIFRNYKFFPIDWWESPWLDKSKLHYRL